MSCIPIEAGEMLSRVYYWEMTSRSMSDACYRRCFISVKSVTVPGRRYCPSSILLSTTSFPILLEHLMSVRVKRHVFLEFESSSRFRLVQKRSVLSEGEERKLRATYRSLVSLFFAFQLCIFMPVEGTRFYCC